MKNSARARMGWKDRVYSVLFLIVSLSILFIILYPLYFVVIASLSDPFAVSGGTVVLVPKGLQLEGYKKILEDSRIWVGYRNTLLYTTAGTAVNLAATIPAAYALSRPDFRARRVLMGYFMFTNFFSGGLIPTYITLDAYGMTNTVWAMLIPFSVNVFNLIVTRSFFEASLPPDLLEAARIDGCSDLRFFFQFALPLSKAILCTIGLYYAAARWNDYFNALIYLRDSGLQPLALKMREILLKSGAMSGGTGSSGGEAQFLADVMKYGAIIVSTLPMAAVYPFVQKYFTQGVMVGAVKG